MTKEDFRTAGLDGSKERIRPPEDELEEAFPLDEWILDDNGVPMKPFQERDVPVASKLSDYKSASPEDMEVDMTPSLYFGEFYLSLAWYVIIYSDLIPVAAIDAVLFANVGLTDALTEEEELAAQEAMNDSPTGTGDLLENEIYPCLYCGSLFHSKRVDHLFCSRSHRRRWATQVRLQASPRTCKNCGKAFVPAKSQKQVYCTPNCRKRRYDRTHM